MRLNELAIRRCRLLMEQAEELSVGMVRSECGTQLVDCGISHSGGIEAGIAVAEVCLAGLGRVTLAAPRPDVWPGPAVQIWTDQPVAACMASQYAGWQIAADDYFAMGSGPMRAARGGEELFSDIGYREQPDQVVGVLECGKLPTASVCVRIAEQCQVAADRVTLLVAPTASIAGSIQVVARTVETCLHKMHELKFDLSQVVSGYGVAPLPPVAPNDLTGIGRTNDAVLYGGEVTLWLRADDHELLQLGPRIPSCASADFGSPFGEIFKRYEYDFYRIDPLLFSPARVTLINLTSGKTHQFGELVPDVLRQSFAG